MAGLWRNPFATDGSIYIGAVLVIPALIYLSYWDHSTADFRQDAQLTTAQVSDIRQVRVKRYRRPDTYEWCTFLRYADPYGGQQEEGILGRRAGVQPGDNLHVYASAAPPYVCYPGVRGIWAGRVAALGVILLGCALSLLAWVQQRSQRPPPDPERSSFDEIRASREDWDA